MQIQQGQELVVLKSSKTRDYWRWDSVRKLYVRLDESDLAKAIPGYRELTEKARAKKFKKYLKEARVIDCGRMPEDLPNTQIGRASCRERV